MIKTFIVFIACNLVFSQSISVNRLDSTIQSQLKKIDFVGLGMVITEGDSILFEKGYGFSNRENGKKWNTKTDIARIASVSKLFTTIAVLQMVEKGLLDLDTDINRYLTEPLNLEFDDDLTLRHLLTHTAGFEDKVLGTYTRDINDVEPLRSYLFNHQPKQIYPPGLRTLYSNYSFALAGYLVELQSGVPFFDYIDAKIIKPLHMNQTFVDEAQLSRVMSSYSKNRNTKDFEIDQMILYRNLAPAGMVNSAVHDMSNLMRVLSNQEQSDLILAASSKHQLFRLSHSMINDEDGYGLSMYQKSYHDNMTWHIGGQLPSFSSQLVFFGENSAMYVSANTAMNRDLINLIDTVLTGHFFEQSEMSMHPARSIPNPDRYTGRYRWNRYTHHELDYIRGLFSDTRVLYYDEGVFKFYGSPQSWVVENDSIFIEQATGKKIQFKLTKSGSVIGLHGHFVLDMPVYLEKFTTLEHPQFIDNSIGVLMMLFLLFPIGWLLLFIYKSLRKKESSAEFQRSNWWITINAILFLMHLIMIRFFLKDYIDYITGERMLIIMIYSLSFIVLGTLVMMFRSMIRDFVQKRMPVILKIIYIMMMFSITLYYLMMTYFKTFWFSI